MKKVSSILIFLATFAIFGISTESFTKNRFIFSSQTNEPSLAEIRQIALLKRNYDARGGPEGKWTGSYQGTPTLSEAQALVDSLEIAKLKRHFLDNGGLESAWRGTGDQGKPTIEEARKLRRDVRLIVIGNVEIQRLKTDYLALGGSADAWKGSGPQGTPNISEAQTLHSQLAAEIATLKTQYEALGGLASAHWTGSYQGSPTLSQAEALVEPILTQIANWRKLFGSGDQTWTGFLWTGSGPQAAPTLSEAQILHDDAVIEIQRLKTEYDALGGEANAWTGSYNNPETTDKVENTPTLSEAQALVQLLKKSESSQTLIISLAVGIGGALLLFGGLGYWFYRHRKKVSVFQ